MGTRHTAVSGLASVGFPVLRCGLVTTLAWIGALNFTDYEVENAEVLVTASPQLSVLGEALLKDTVLLGAALVTAAESLRAAHAGNQS